MRSLSPVTVVCSNTGAVATEGCVFRVAMDQYVACEGPLIYYGSSN